MRSTTRSAVGEFGSNRGTTNRTVIEQCRRLRYAAAYMPARRTTAQRAVDWLREWRHQAPGRLRVVLGIACFLVIGWLAAQGV